VFLNWGFKLLKVELLEILPSPTIQESMHKQIAAERMRRAAIITADGYREQTKTEGLYTVVIRQLCCIGLYWTFC
jgi:regulator of protease activity HflC (stomatin/prohibitin superfamily)